MGVGPNYILDKAFKATGSTAYAQFDLVVASGDGTACARSTVANGDVLGVCQEAVDAGKVTTGKVFLNVRLLGISRVKTSAAIAVRDRLATDNSARCKPITRAIAGAQPALCFGIAMTAATAQNQYIDALLTPGATY